MGGGTRFYEFFPGSATLFSTYNIMTTDPITITDSTPLVLDLDRLFGGPRIQHIRLLEIFVNSGGSTVYFGDTPRAAITLGMFNPAAGQKMCSFQDFTNTTTVTRKINGRHDVRMGQQITALDGNSVTGVPNVTAVYDTHFLVDTNWLAFSDVGRLTFTDPAISDANGQPIVSGGYRAISVESREAEQLLMGSLTFVVPTAGSAVVRFRYK